MSPKNSSKKTPKKSPNKLRVITVYEQEIYIYSDGVKRIVPIFIRHVDRESFSERVASRHAVFANDTNIKVNVFKNTISTPYPYRDIKPKIEFKCETKDIKPCIKCETKDVKLFPKTEIKDEKLSKEELKKSLLEHRFGSLCDDYFCCSDVKRSDSCDDLCSDKKCEPISSSSESSMSSCNDFEEETTIAPILVTEYNDEESLSPIEMINCGDNHSMASIDSERTDTCSPGRAETSERQDSYCSDATDIYDTSDYERQLSINRLTPHKRITVFQIILSRMSIKEKLMTEWVCKEWRTALVAQQKSLIIEYKPTYNLGSDEIIGKNVVFLNNNYNNFVEISNKLIEKFSNLSEIQILCPNDTNINPIVDKICERFQRLDSVKFEGKISKGLIHTFGTMFGKHLLSLDINSGDYGLNEKELSDSQLLSKNLKTISVNHSLETLVIEVESLPQLRELLDVNSDDIDGLSLVAESPLCQQITKISFRAPELFRDYLNNIFDIQTILEKLSAFEHLEYLDFYFSGHYLNNEFNPISKCTKLKELHIMGNDVFFPLDILQSFQRLQVLGLYIDCKEGANLSFLSLKALDLTELWIYCDIHCNELLAILKHMKRLKTLHLKSNLCWQKEVIKIVSSGNSLQTIYLEDSLIIECTLNAMIKRAKKRPSLQYNMFSQLYDPKNKNLTECKRLIRPEFPPNLTVIMDKELNDPFIKKAHKSRKISELSASSTDISEQTESTVKTNRKLKKPKKRLRNSLIK